jgi:hypothetical protein
MLSRNTTVSAITSIRVPQFVRNESGQLQLALAAVDDDTHIR